MSNNPYFQSTPSAGSSAPPPPANRSRGSNPLFWILGIGGGVVLLCVLMCCGGGYALIGFGMNVVAEDIRMQLRDHPTIQEHIGEMESLDVNFTASMAHPDDDTFVYEASGSKGKGELTVQSLTLDDDSEDIRAATLRLPDGQTFELDL